MRALFSANSKIALPSVIGLKINNIVLEIKYISNTEVSISYDGIRIISGYKKFYNGVLEVKTIEQKKYTRFLANCLV